MTTITHKKIRDATHSKTTNPEEAVKIDFDQDGNGAREPITLTDLFSKIVRDYGDNAALAYKADGNNQWNKITYNEYKTRVDHMAKVFIQLGLKRYHSVAVLAFNSVEWFVTEMATIHAGGIITGVYTTNSADSTLHVLESSRANIVVVDDSKQMEKIRQIKDKLPNLKAVIQIQSPFEPYVKRDDGYYRWAELEDMIINESVEQEYLKRLESIAVNECCCLVYTSGTVGNPKGVMLTHDNLSWDPYATSLRMENCQIGKEVLISYLPLSHVAAQMVDIFMSLTLAGTVYFADRDALKGSLLKTLQEVRPTRFLGVPRVYEKIQEKMMAVGAQSGHIKRLISGWVKDVTLQYNLDRLEGKQTNMLQYKIAKSLFLGKVKNTLGLNRCVSIVSAAAPISIETKKYFMSLDICIIEAFGMSETSGAHCLSTLNSPNLTTVGKSVPGTQAKIANPDENGHGELCLRGRNIFMGYVQEADKTKETFDDDNWLLTGDIGYIDSDDNIYITGRIKELIITAGGENIPPVHIENLVKKEIPVISNAFLVGDKRKFLTMLITLKTEVSPEGEPKDELTHETLKWIEEIGLKYTKLSEIINAGPDETVMKTIQKGIDRANKSSISNAQKIQKVALLPKDFSIATGELGPTLKLKRNYVNKKYKDIIENLYN